ncbi:MAG: c-type cytochrome [Oceanococcus sp.]
MKTILPTTVLAAITAFAISACGQSGNTSSAAVAKMADADPATMEIYNRSCISCHTNGAGGAPRTGDLTAWAPRVEQGMELLLEHTMAGYKGMPPMGMCMECNDEQFAALIEYMAGQKVTAP